MLKFNFGLFFLAGKMSHWSMKLVETMADPESVVIKTEQLVAIKDKFPKAKFHFLICPLENIDTIFKLTRKDVELLNEMDLLATNVIETTGKRKEIFRIGFHAEPSMMRLHLHVISQDFISPCLKNKKHWNSFTTEFFWPVSKILEDLETHGKVQKLSAEKVKELLNKPLTCNSCSFSAKNIPDLKNHLLSHESQYL